MILISHRGNTTGEDPQENKPSFIDQAIKKGFDVEVDVWLKDKDLFLGHDNPQYPIDLQFLKSRPLWCHAKDFKALNFMLDNNITCFWHEEDQYTITSNNQIWTYPLKKVEKRSIIVCKTLEDSREYAKRHIFGICSDYVGIIEEKK
jgi:hypothetical protein